MCASLYDAEQDNGRGGEGVKVFSSQVSLIPQHTQSVMLQAVIPDEPFQPHHEGKQHRSQCHPVDEGTFLLRAPFVGCKGCEESTAFSKPVTNHVCVSPYQCKQTQPIRVVACLRRADCSVQPLHRMHFCREERGQGLAGLPSAMQSCSYSNVSEVVLQIRMAFPRHSSGNDWMFAAAPDSSTCMPAWPPWSSA